MAGRITWVAILAATAAVNGLPVSTLTSPARRQSVSHARQRAVYLARRLRPDLSFPFLAQRLGERDHSTLVYANQRVEARLSDPAHRDEEYAALQAILCELELTELRVAELPTAARQIIDSRIQRCEQIIAALRNRRSLLEGAQP